MVLHITDYLRTKGGQDSGPTHNRDNPDRPMQDRLMTDGTDNVVDFPGHPGMEYFYNKQYAYDLELTELTSEAIDIGLPLMTIIGVLQSQIHFLLALEHQEDDEDE